MESKQEYREGKLTEIPRGEADMGWLEATRALTKRDEVAPTNATVLAEMGLKSHASVASHIQTLASRN